MVSSDRITAGGDRVPPSLSGWPTGLLAADEPVSRAGHLMTFLETPRLEGQFDLSVEMTRTANAMTAVFRYDTGLFLPSTVEGLAGRFERMVAAACADPDALVERVPLLSDDERRRVLAMSGQPSPAGRGSEEQP